MRYFPAALLKKIGAGTGKSFSEALIFAFRIRFKKLRLYLNYERKILCTGKSFSEALILASTNPQYDKRLFMELP